jgi:hypothetical protein
VNNLVKEGFVATVGLAVHDGAPRLSGICRSVKPRASAILPLNIWGRRVPLSEFRAMVPPFRQLPPRDFAFPGTRKIRHCLTFSSERSEFF